MIIGIPVCGSERLENRDTVGARLRPPLIAWAIELESVDDKALFYASVDKQLTELLSILIGCGMVKRR
jgi:hypothetical protein